MFTLTNITNQRDTPFGHKKKEEQEKEIDRGRLLVSIRERLGLGCVCVEQGHQMAQDAPLDDPLSFFLVLVCVSVSARQRVRRKREKNLFAENLCLLLLIALLFFFLESAGISVPSSWKIAH